MQDYQKQATDFLTKYGLEFRAVLVGNDCPQFCEDKQADRDMDKVDVFPRKTHIHGKHYRCTISGKERGHVSFDFWNSYADEEENAFNFGSMSGWNEQTQTSNTDGILTVCRENRYWDKYRGKRPLAYSVIRPKGKRKTVSAYDLLACIQKSDVGTFEDFASEFGYDSDSRKAESIYHAVVKEWRKVENFFTQTEIEAIL
jgi:hypothetical protein